MCTEDLLGLNWGKFSCGQAPLPQELGLLSLFSLASWPVSSVLPSWDGGDGTVSTRKDEPMILLCCGKWDRQHLES